MKYLRFTKLGCKDIEIRKCKFVAKTEFFSKHSRTIYDTLKYLISVVI